MLAWSLSPVHTGAARAESPCLLSDEQWGSQTGFQKNFLKANLPRLVLVAVDISSGHHMGHPVGYFLSPLATDSGRSHFSTLRLN